MVKVNTKGKKKITDIERDRYYGPLITHGVSLGYIKLYPWISLPISLFFILVGAMRIILALLKQYFLYALLLMWLVFFLLVLTL